MPLKFDENGIQVRQGAEILNDWEQRFLRIYGAGTQVFQNSGSDVSKVIAEFTDRDAKMDEIIEALYYSSYPSTAGGASLDRVGEITGHTRLDAGKSFLTQTVYAAGAPSTVINAGELTMSVLQAGDLFVNTNNFTLGVLGDLSAASITRVGTTVTVTIPGGHGYPLDSRVFAEGADQEEYNGLQQITDATGTTFEYELTGVLPDTPATGTFLIREATPFSAEAIEEGPISAIAGTLAVIEISPTGDLERVENAADAVLGREVEPDPQFRERRNDTLGALGGGTPEAIKAILLERVSGITNATVFKNDDDFPDGLGIPPHSVEALVAGGDDQDIFDALTGAGPENPGAVSGGIRQHGNITGSVTDSSGNPQPSAFSRLVDVRIYVILTIETNSDPQQGPVFPVNGEQLILDNLSSVPFEGNQNVTRNLLHTAVTVDPLTNLLNVPGVTRIEMLFDKIPIPLTDITVVITPTEKADIDSGDISGTIDGNPI